VVAGGTEVMVRVNAGVLRPRGLILIDRVDELRGVWVTGGEVILGAATTCADLAHAGVREVLPALAQAARAIGGPGLRTRATLGGNVLSGRRPGGPTVPTPGRDLLCALIALRAVAVCRSPGAWRQVPITELYARDGGVQLGPGELLTALRVPVSAGPQGFMKVGARGAAARPVLTFALAADQTAHTVTCAIGGFAPTAARVDHAGQWLAGQVDWAAAAIPDPAVYGQFARLVAEGLSAPPVAGPAGLSTAGVPRDYRQRAAEVCARRALVRALPPSGWLDQVADYQQRAQFLRQRAAVERAERGLPSAPPVPDAGLPLVSPEGGFR
jgi:CO/xanthine dehydrogenase FAD-binding subunit